MNSLSRIAVMALLLIAASSAPAVFAQTRLTDKDLEATMKNLVSDSKSFQSAFNSYVGKTTIRKTSQEKDAKVEVKSFVQQSETMLNQFKKTKKATPSINNLQTSAVQIDGTIRSVGFDTTTTARWDKVNTELNIVANAFSLPPTGSQAR